MLIACVLLCFFSGAIAKVKEKHYFNPVTVMMSVWEIVISLSYQHFFGLNELSNEILTVLFLGLLGFTFGYLLYATRHKMVISCLYAEILEKMIGRRNTV